LWLTKGLGPGGAERLLVSFARGADHAAFAFGAAYLLPWKHHVVADLERDNIDVRCLEAPRPLDLRWVLRLRRLIRDRDVEVVHLHSPLVAAFARLGVRTMRRRPMLMGTEHNVWSSHRWPTRWMNRSTIGLEDITVAVSDEVRSSMPSHIADRTEVIAHGVDVAAIAARRSERQAARSELGLDNELVIVTVANLRANKDYPTLLHAAAKLVAEGHGVRFVSVGQGPLADELAAIRDRLGLGDRFRFLGYQEDPIRVLVAGDVFALSSRYEGLPIAMLEAFAAGLPVVATSVGGIPSALRDGTDGLLVPPRDPDALAGALVKLLDPAVRERLTMSIDDARRFGMQAAIERQQSIYRDLASRRR
jgi:glycosyltransferase involved in cell wall biosynthesis